MNTFTIDKAAKSETLGSTSILRFHNQNIMLTIMEIESKEPRITRKQICNELGFSDSTIQRYGDDINMDSPYN